MKKGDLVKYVGRGFLGFDKNDTDMIVIEIQGFNVEVFYKGQKMLVRDYEVKA